MSTIKENLLGAIAPDAVYFHEGYSVKLKEQSHLWDCGPRFIKILIAGRAKDTDHSDQKENHITNADALCSTACPNEIFCDWCHIMFKSENIHVF